MPVIVLRDLMIEASRLIAGEGRRRFQNLMTARLASRFKPDQKVPAMLTLSYYLAQLEICKSHRVYSIKVLLISHFGSNTLSRRISSFVTSVPQQ